MKISLILGNLDSPTDGVADYCVQLEKALRARGHDVHLFHIATRGKIDFHRLPSDLGDAALLQYTHLSWSRRGFPLRALFVTHALRRRVRMAVPILHDPLPFSGDRS